MPKSLPIHPDAVRQRGFLEFTPIPLNQYSRNLSTEAERHSRESLLRIHRDMALIRAFETMLDEVKIKGAFAGIAYNHRGPAHLSIGQEASAVGQAFALEPGDAIFGSHRSHGETLAKGLSAIHKLDDESLTTIMEEYFDGEILRVVERDFTTPDSVHTPSLSIKELAVDFLLYGTLAEIFGRETGFNRGMGGSMHVFFTPFGIFPNNAIVGGSADISVGAALYRRVHEKSGIVVCNIGDASSACGPVWEAMQFSAMEQFKTLWRKPDATHKGGLPILFNFVNNFYGMGGQPVGETGGAGILARIGAGVNPEQMHAERVDGYQPLAIADATFRKKELLERGEGPALLDTITYRFSGHSPSDASSYREKSEIEAWKRIDSLATYGESLMQAGLCEANYFDAVFPHIDSLILRAFKRAISPEISPRANLFVSGNLLERTMFSDSAGESSASLEAQKNGEEGISQGEAERKVQVSALSPFSLARKRLGGKSRSGIGENGDVLPKSKCITLRDAIFEAVLSHFEKDDSLIAYGEENRDWGGAFGVYRGLTEVLPYHRLFNSPISEAAIIGTAVGYAMSGGRALVELMYCDFLGRAGDELFNQLAKWGAMSGGVLKLPVVVRVSVGSKYGAQHSQDWSSLCAHIPGLKVVFPSTPYDAKGLMSAALSGTDPVIFFESQRIYDATEQFHKVEGVPEEDYEIALGEPDIKREGNDLTILTVGAALYRAIEAADTLKAEYGLSAEVIDARSLVPFDFAKVLASVKKTGRILLVSDACERGSLLHTFASKISQFAFSDLDAPPIVVGAQNWITPPDEVEEAFFPFPADILDAIHLHLLPLSGYTPKRFLDNTEAMRRSRRGI